MLSYDHFHKQVNYYQSLMGLTGKLPSRVYAYIRSGSITNPVPQLLPSEEFPQYQFVEYTYQGSFYPVVKQISTE